jgi:hypothetical protein
VPNQHHRLADPVQWMVDGFLPLDFLFAEALDDVEQLRVGVGHGHCERGGGDGDAAHRLVEGEARPEAPLVFGQVGGWPMRLAPRDGAPVVSGRSADPRHEAHQHEVRELDDVRHGDRIRKFYAARAGALHEFEMVVGEDWVKAGEVPQFGLQIRSVGQEITKRIAGEASPQPVFEAKKRPVTRAAAVRALASFSSEIQARWSSTASADSPASSRTGPWSTQLAHGQGRNFLAYLLIMALMHLREEDQGRTGTTH